MIPYTIINEGYRLCQNPPCNELINPPGPFLAYYLGGAIMLIIGYVWTKKRHIKAPSYSC
jgi:hypothetical protein